MNKNENALMLTLVEKLVGFLLISNKVSSECFLKIALVFEHSNKYDQGSA